MCPSHQAVVVVIKRALEEDRAGRVLDDEEVEAIRDRARRYWDDPGWPHYTPEDAEALLSDRAALLNKAHDALHGMDGYERGYREGRKEVADAALKEDERVHPNDCGYEPPFHAYLIACSLEIDEQKSPR